MNFKNFTECSVDELKMILEWRNSKAVREASFNDSIIKLDDHLNFVANLKNGGGNNTKKYYFLISDDKGYLGVISFTGINEKEAEVGYYKNPARTEKGVGAVLLNEACLYAKHKLNLKEIITEVLDDNPPSITSMERSGFAQQKKLSGHIYVERNNKKIGVIVFKKML